MPLWRTLCRHAGGGRRWTRLAPLVGALVLVVNFASGLRADGIVLPLVAAPPVTMPDQRALLVWHEKEQTETLVIESRFTGSGHDFAWVVPLPSKPAISPATRGTLPTVAAQFRVHLVEAEGWAALLVNLLVPWSLWVLFAGWNQGWRFCQRGWVLLAPAVVIAVVAPRFIISMIGFVLIGWLSKDTTKGWSDSILRVLLLTGAILMMLVPGCVRTLDFGGGAPLAAGVEVERSVIGDYEVVVLAGGDDGEITQWLRANRFALPAAAEPVVAEHARAGGFFAAVKLRRTDDNAQPTAAAPLRFTFKTPQPVYPMKLTGAGATRPLAVELFVFGNARAGADGLAVQSCVQVQPVESGLGGAHDNSADVYAHENHFSAYQLPLAHPALSALCAGTTVATRLTGTLTPSQMTRDLAIGWQPFTESVVPVKCSASDAAWIAGLAAAVGLALGALVLGWRWREDAPSWREATIPWRSGLSVVLAAAALGGGVWLALPTVSVLDGGQAYRARVRQEEMSARCQQAAKDFLPGALTEDRLRKLVVPVLADYARSHGIAVPSESDSPSNYVFRALPDGHWRLVWFDDVGGEMFWSKTDF